LLWKPIGNNLFFVGPHSASSLTLARQTLHPFTCVATSCVGLAFLSLIDSSVPGLVCFNSQQTPGSTFVPWSVVQTFPETYLNSNAFSCGETKTSSPLICDRQRMAYAPLKSDKERHLKFLCNCFYKSIPKGIQMHTTSENLGTSQLNRGMSL